MDGKLVPFNVGFSRELLECPYNMVGGFPQGWKSGAQGRRCNAFDDLASEVSHHHFCRPYDILSYLSGHTNQPCSNVKGSYSWCEN